MGKEERELPDQIWHIAKDWVWWAKYDSKYGFEEKDAHSDWCRGVYYLWRKRVLPWYNGLS